MNKLINTLDESYPHFVRCIIPNRFQSAGVFDNQLVLKQLHSNGIFEGVRIYQKGLPIRIKYLKFIQCFSSLNPTACIYVHDKDSAKTASIAILDGAKTDPELYRLGLTKVLFKAGVLETLEERRDTIITKYLIRLQAQIRCFITQKNMKKIIDHRNIMKILRKNIKEYIALKNWEWWKLMANVKPLLELKKEVIINFILFFKKERF